MRKHPHLLDLFLASQLAMFLVKLVLAHLKPWRTLALCVLITSLLGIALLSSALNSAAYQQPTNWPEVVKTLEGWRKIEQQLPPSRAITQQRMLVESALQLSPTPRENSWLWPAPTDIVPIPE